MSTVERKPGEAPIKAEYVFLYTHGVYGCLTCSQRFRKEKWIDSEGNETQAGTAVFGDEEVEGHKFTDDSV